MRAVPLLQPIRETVQVLFGRSLRARFARAAFWSTGGSVSAQLGAFVSTIVCARILGPVDFGKLGIVRSTVLMFGTVAGLGLGAAASKYVAEYRTTNRERAGRVIGLLLMTGMVVALAVMVVLIALARPVAASLSSADLVFPLRLGALLLITNTFLGIQLGVLAGFERFRAIAYVNAADGLFNVIFPVLGASFWGVDGAILAFGVAGIAGYAVKHVAIGRVMAESGVRVQLLGARGEMRALFDVAFPSVLVGVAIQPFDWFSRLMLVRRGGGFTELGVFTAAYSLAQLVTFVPSQVAAPVVPIASNLIAAGDMRRARKLITSSQILVFALAALTGLGLIVLSTPALTAYGRGFARGRMVLVIMALAYVVCSPTLVTRAVFTATGKMWWQASQTAVWGVLLASGAFIFARRGAEGLALAYLLSYAVFTLLQLGTQGRAVQAAVERPASTNAMT